MIRRRDVIWAAWQEARRKISDHQEKNEAEKRKRDGAVDLEAEAAKDEPKKEAKKARGQSGGRETRGRRGRQ